MSIKESIHVLAKEIKDTMDGSKMCFMAVPRMDLTRRLREISGHSSTRIGRTSGQQIDDALALQGLVSYPKVAETTTGDCLRVYRSGSVVSDLVGLIVHPSSVGDEELGRYLATIKSGRRMAKLGRGDRIPAS